eukprot:6475219-Amphidinium_carterae.2
MMHNYALGEKLSLTKDAAVLALGGKQPRTRSNVGTLSSTCELKRSGGAWHARSINVLQKY